jgi:integral membrane protein
MTALKTFRIVSFVEGLSYLALVGVAMPLKYIWDMPQAVRIVGMAHGVLFVIFVASLVVAAVRERMGIANPISYFILSMIPFGFVAIEYLLRQNENAGDTTSAAVPDA